MSTWLHKLKSWHTLTRTCSEKLLHVGPQSKYQVAPHYSIHQSHNNNPFPDVKYIPLASSLGHLLQFHIHQKLPWRTKRERSLICKSPTSLQRRNTHAQSEEGHTCENERICLERHTVAKKKRPKRKSRRTRREKKNHFRGPLLPSPLPTADSLHLRSSTKSPSLANKLCSPTATSPVNAAQPTVSSKPKTTPVCRSPLPKSTRTAAPSRATTRCTRSADSFDHGPRATIA